jgi:hypothetical protein
MNKNGLPNSLEDRLLQEILEKPEPRLEALEKRYSIGEKAAKRLLLRNDLLKDRRMELGEESPVIEKAAESLLLAAEKRIRDDFHDDASYRSRLLQEIALLKEDAYHPHHREALMGLYLAYEIAKANPYDYFGDGWLNGDCLLAFLLRLTPFNPIANAVPLEYFEQLLVHGDYLPRLILRERILSEKGNDIAKFLSLDPNRDHEEIWEIRAALYRSSPLWLHPRRAETPFGTIAAAQIAHLDGDYLCKIPLEGAFSVLLEKHCVPYFRGEKRVASKGFPTTRETLFLLLYERSADAPYAYELTRAISQDKNGYWAKRSEELSQDEKTFYSKTCFLQPLPYCFERAFEEYAVTSLKQVK